MALYEKIRSNSNHLIWLHWAFTILTAIIAVTAMGLTTILYMNYTEEVQCCKEENDITIRNGKSTIPHNPCQNSESSDGNIVQGLLETTSSCLGRKIVYCDKKTLGGGWVRLHYKTGAQQCTPFRIDAEQLKCLLENKKFDFAVSSDINTVNSGEYSWTLSNAWLRATDGIGNIYQALEQVSNCNGPDGTPWTNNYANGYLFVNGTLGTLGTWSRMRTGCMCAGCDGPWSYINEKRSFRMGGGSAHESEIIHTVCNGYRYDTDFSVTSKWNTDNVRAMWIRVA